MEDNPQLKDHPVLYRRDWKRRAIPLVLHGDGTGQSHEASMAASWLDQMARAPKQVYEHYRRLKVKEELLEIAASSSASEPVKVVGEVPSSVAEEPGVAGPLTKKWQNKRGGA